MGTDITLENVSLAQESALPALIKVFEYNHDWIIDKTTTIDSAMENRNGDMGSSKEYRYSISTFPKITEGTIGIINNRLKKIKFPVFTRDFLKENFFIISVPDYGNQGMSAYYRDFVPYVFINGRKVWNKYIAIIKDYVSKTAYILIDKKLLEANQTAIFDEAKKADSKCIVDISLRDIIEGEPEPIEITPEINVSNNSLTISGDYSFWNKALSNYNLVLTRTDAKNNKKIYTLPLNPEYPYIKTYQFSREGDTPLAVSPLSNYFRQAFKEKYLSEKKDPDKNYQIERNNEKSNVDIRLTIKFDSMIFQLEDKDKAAVVFSQRVPSAQYLSSNELASLKDYLVYNKDGEFCPKEIPVSDELEIIQETSFKRKAIVTGTGSLAKFNPNAFFKQQQVYGYRSHFSVKGYSQAENDNENLFLRTDSNGAKYIICYDEGGIETAEKEPYDNSNFELASIKSYISEIWDVVSGKTFYDEETAIFRVMKIKPAFTLFLKDAAVHPEIYAISRVFPIKYKSYIIDDNTTYYQLPDWIIANDPNDIIGHGDTPTLTLAEGIKKEFIDSLEPFLLFDYQLTSEMHFKIVAPRSFTFKSTFKVGGYDEDSAQELELEYPYQDATPDMVNENGEIPQECTENSRIVNFYDRNRGALAKGPSLTDDPDALLFQDDDGSLVYVGYYDESGEMVPVITQ